MKKTVDEPSAARFSSGVPGFDEVLGGGLLVSRVYVLEGLPGTGKTVLATQLCFEAAARGVRSLFVSVLAELHGNMVINLQSLAFYDPKVIGRDLRFLSLSRGIQVGDHEQVLKELSAVIRDHRPSLVVLDGFSPADRAGWSQPQVSTFVQNFQALMSLTGTTAVLTSSVASGTPSPERPLVDGIIALEESLVDMRSTRSMRVRKFRGGLHLEGRHSFRIDAGGVRVFPRLEARGRLAGSPERARSGVRSLGVPGLDRLLGGAVVAGSTTLVLGAGATGKTTLGLQFLAEGSRRGESCLLFGFFEEPEVLLERARTLPFPLVPPGQDPARLLVWQPPGTYDLDELAVRLLELVRASKVERLFIDSLLGLEPSADPPGRFAGFFLALSRELRNLGVTTLLSAEPGGPRGCEGDRGAVPAICENVLLLRHLEEGGRMKRLLTVLKTREASHDAGLHPLSIDRRGLAILETRAADDLDPPAGARGEGSSP
jgi:circadian clock protein KaiC